jgi:F-type H+-transporting ATPase subunit b
MNAIVLLAFSDGGGQIQQLAKTFGVDWPHLIAQIISFAIVCVLLQQFAYKRVLAVLEKRRQQIAQSLENTEKIKIELTQAETRRREMMAEASARANKLIEEARAAAARVEELETQKAVATAAQIVAKSREAAEQDYARMLAGLKHEVGRLVVQTTALVVGKVLTPEDQRRLVEEATRHLAEKSVGGTV